MVALFSWPVASTLACRVNSSGVMCVPWQAHTIFTSFLPKLYVTPDMVLPFGPVPVVDTQGRSGYDPDPPNLTFGAMPGLIPEPEPMRGNTFSTTLPSSKRAEEDAPASAVHKEEKGKRLTSQILNEQKV